jgi:hypothetical protein
MSSSMRAWMVGIAAVAAAAISRKSASTTSRPGHFHGHPVRAGGGRSGLSVAQVRRIASAGVVQGDLRSES